VVSFLDDWRERARRALVWAVVGTLLLLPLDWAGSKGRFGWLDAPRSLSEVLQHVPVRLIVFFTFSYLWDVRPKSGRH
jgi:hypothetical protein